MTLSTQGIEVNWRSRSARAAVELVSSMRFAISLLTLICIASVIGTVLKQQEPFVNYVNQFGPFWAQLFGQLGLYTVYSAWWFLLILAFLVLSTSMCISRNTPKIFSDLKQFKENLREQSLLAFGHRAQATLNESSNSAAQRVQAQLEQTGWRVKLSQRANGVMVAAKRGGSNRLGYIAAHSAIVLVCVGGLLDGDLMVRAQMWWGNKTPYAGTGLISQVADEHRLSAATPAFRGNLLVAEGSQSSTALLSQPKGVVLQELPFSIELKKFIVEYYSTGMPKLFASDIVIHDKVSGEQKTARVEVNHPAHYKGIEIYQSSFDDGGSELTLKAQALNLTDKPFEVQGTVGGSTVVQQGTQTFTLEYTGLRVINVEDFSKEAVAPSSLRHAIEGRLGSANKTTRTKVLRNVGPSVSYKLRDAAGQAREFQNYMLPVTLDEGGAPVYLLGVRETPAQPFRYLRLPLDSQAGFDLFLRLRSDLDSSTLRSEAVQRYVSQVLPAAKPELSAQLTQSATRVLDLFATGGLQAVSDFIESSVPAPERDQASQVLVRILNGTLFELLQMARQQSGLKPALQDETTRAYMAQAVISLSDAKHYPAPLFFQLKDFKHVQASVFQVTRSPGKKVVYLGCLLLILGIFAMLYVRERRLWVWLAPSGDTSCDARMAMSCNRQTMDVDKEFENLKTTLGFC